MIKYTIQEIIFAIFFSPGGAHTKGMLFLLHLGLEGVTGVDTDPKKRFVSFKVTTSNEGSLFVPLQGIARESSWLGGAFLKYLKKYFCKITFLIFFSTGFYRVVISKNSFGKLSSFCSFCLSCLLFVEFDVIFINFILF